MKFSLSNKIFKEFFNEDLWINSEWPCVAKLLSWYLTRIRSTWCDWIHYEKQDRKHAIFYYSAKKAENLYNDGMCTYPAESIHHYFLKLTLLCVVKFKILRKVLFENSSKAVTSSLNTMRPWQCTWKIYSAYTRKTAKWGTMHQNWRKSLPYIFFSHNLRVELAEKKSFSWETQRDLAIRSFLSHSRSYRFFFYFLLCFSATTIQTPNDDCLRNPMRNLFLKNFEYFLKFKNVENFFKILSSIKSSKNFSRWAFASRALSVYGSSSSMLL